MANMSCPNEKYLTYDGRCCDRCAAGQYVKAECSQTKRTECAKCGHGFYTATKNYVNKCQGCSECSSTNNKRKLKDCTAQEDTVCECVTGFYCSDDLCDHCLPVTRCPLGEGVKVQATRTKDTICAPCEEGTYSNITSFQSPCQTQTRCEDFGRVLETPGTPKTDAICGPFKSYCHWMLPAGLWSGLVLTLLVLLFGLICWRSKRKSCKAVGSSDPVTLVEVAPAAPVTQLEMSLCFTELDGHCPDSCTVEGCKSPLFHPDDNGVGCGTQDSVDSSLPITPLKASVSFSGSNHINGRAGYCASNFLRTYSEPQEDEWCGT